MNSGAIRGSLVAGEPQTLTAAWERWEERMLGSRRLEGGSGTEGHAVAGGWEATQEQGWGGWWWAWARLWLISGWSAQLKGLK